MGKCGVQKNDPESGSSPVGASATGTVLPRSARERCPVSRVPNEGITVSAQKQRRKGYVDRL